MKTPKSCSSCRYWLPRVSTDGIGACTAPLPISLSGFLIRQKDTFDDAGADCPAWRKRIVRKRALPLLRPLGTIGLNSLSAEPEILRWVYEQAHAGTAFATAFDARKAYGEAHAPIGPKNDEIKLP